MFRRVFRHTFFLSLPLIASVLAWSPTAMAQREPLPPGNVESPPAAAKPIAAKNVSGEKQREGATFQGKIGVFRQTGARYSFYFGPGNKRFTCLENLCLERVLQVIGDRQEDIYWNIDGQFTEFQGENFLLLRRAVLSPTSDASSSAPPQ